MSRCIFSDNTTKLGQHWLLHWASIGCQHWASVHFSNIYLYLQIFPRCFLSHSITQSHEYINMTISINVMNAFIKSLEYTDIHISYLFCHIFCAYLYFVDYLRSFLLGYAIFLKIAWSNIIAYREENIFCKILTLHFISLCINIKMYFLITFLWISSFI